MTTTTQAAVERPTAAFVLSLLAGLFILAGSGTAMMAVLPVGGSPHNYGGMMGGYYGGMMGGYYGMMGGYYGMMGGLGFGGGWWYGLVALGIVSGAAILVGAVMIYSQPGRTPTWGAVILVFSIVSLLGMGGFFLGAILGFIGGILSLTWKPG